MSSSVQPASQATPSPPLILFARGVIALLTSWPVLRIAIDQAWGGPESLEKRTFLASEIVDAFEEAQKRSKTAPDFDDVEVLILQAMAEEFNCEIDDGSSEGLARDIVSLWKEVREGRGVEEVERIEGLARQAGASEVQATRQEGGSDSEDEEGEDSESDDEMETDEPPALIPQKSTRVPEVDEDGFTVVGRSGRR
ncbi:hypothetical protein M407DRAFT_242741 [Tulasnella calospora MUT 4182]|uniref:Pre-rRNA-processing protein TSR2 n=1 Tax=Tulasnella calospora MUT 4182 TaxID=1051891 RepID=A0A0C3M6A3_9AGAM|nr:hypothetical protein M407DRAFT_242741 [Tulasnella calospora MUT 4182]